MNRRALYAVVLALCAVALLAEYRDRSTGSPHTLSIAPDVERLIAMHDAVR